MDTDKEMFPVDVETLLDEPTPAEHPDGHELQEWVFTNDKSNPSPRHLFHLLHESAFKNKLGVMHALRKDDHKIATVIVGVDQDAEGNLICWPIARMLTEDEQGLFMTPDGKGGYV